MPGSAGSTNVPCVSRGCDVNPRLVRLGRDQRGSIAFDVPLAQFLTLYKVQGINRAVLLGGAIMQAGGGGLMFCKRFCKS